MAGADALLIVHFPPQHLGEQVWPAQTAPPPPPPVKPDRPSGHVAAGPSRLVFELPEGTRLPYTLGGILAALPGLRLRVAVHATPAGKSSEPGDPEPPRDDQTAIEARCGATARMPPPTPDFAGRPTR